MLVGLDELRDLAAALDGFLADADEPDAPFAGIVYEPASTRTGRMRDWLWFKGLTEPASPDARPLSAREIDSVLGLEPGSVQRALERDQPSESELAIMWIRARRAYRHGGRMRDVCAETGLRQPATQWLVSLMRDTAWSRRHTGLKRWLLLILDPEALSAWAVRRRNGLRLADGSPTTQVELARMLDVSQPVISLALSDLIHGTP